MAFLNCAWRKDKLKSEYFEVNTFLETKTSSSDPLIEIRSYCICTIASSQKGIRRLASRVYVDREKSKTIKSGHSTVLMMMEDKQTSISQFSSTCLDPRPSTSCQQKKMPALFHDLDPILPGILALCKKNQVSHVLHQ